MYISDTILDQFIEEDVPYIDLTSQVIGLDDKEGTIEYITREKLVFVELKRLLGF